MLDNEEEDEEQEEITKEEEGEGEDSADIQIGDSALEDTKETDVSSTEKPTIEN